MTLTKKELDEELKKVNEEIETLNNNLIKALTEVGIEYLDLNTYINLYEALKMRKDKIVYLQALNLE